MKNIATKNLNDYKNQIFCSDCLCFPHYSIEVKSNGIIYIDHICNNSVNKRKIFEEIEIEKNEEIAIKCSYCQTKTMLICTKCNSFICNECLKYHLNYYVIEEEVDNEKYSKEKNKEVDESEDSEYDSDDDSEKEEENEEEKKILYISIFDKQFICNEHQMKYTYYCEKCKINLCNECKICHIHINNFCFKEFKNLKRIKNILERKEENKIYSKLILLSNIFNECFLINKEKKNFNINIIQNYFMIKNIVCFIEENSKSEKINDAIIYYEIKPANNKYFCTSFMGEEFQKFYGVLLNRIQMGHIDSWYKLKNIENNYKKKNNTNNELSIIFNSYNLNLSVMVMDIKTDFSFYKDILDSSQFSLYFSEFANIYEDILLNFKTLEYKFDILKDITFEINYKLDFEIRRKASNLIAKEIIDKFYKNIYNLKITNYRLTNSLNKIKDKINEINEKKIDNEKLKKKLEQKFKRCENLILENAKNELEIFNSDNKVEKENNDIIFVNLDDSDKEIKKVILLNLFLILRKDLNNRFNNFIHNETHKINNIFIGEKKKEKNKDKEIAENKNTEKENNKNNILCSEKLKIIKEINNNLNKKKKKSTINKEIEKLLKYINKDYKSIIPFLSQDEFIFFLEDIKRLYNINFKGNLINSINLVLLAEKKNLLLEEKIYDNKEQIKNEIEKLKEKIEEKNDLKKLLKKIYKILNTNIKDLNGILMDDLEILEEYRNYYDIKNLLKKIGNKILINVKKFKKKKFDSLLNEDRYLIFIILEIMILEKYIKEINEIKNDIKKIKLDEIEKENKIKIEIINFFKNKFNTKKYQDNITIEIWKEYANKKTFLIGDNIKIIKLNEEIISYVKNNNLNDFIKDFVDFFDNELPQIDFTQKDPQNIDILTFMKQNQLDF